MIEKIKEISEKVKTLETKQVPSLIVWLVIAAFAILVIALGVQQYRLWRYNSILKASKIRIEELDSRVQSARLEGIKEAAKKQRTLNHQEVKEIDKKIADYKKKREALKEKVDRMKPTDLLKEFKNEGF